MNRVTPRNRNQPARLAGEKSQAVSARLKLHFAMLSCLGGLVLAAGNDAQSVPAIAVFFAVFGYIFVDWLELFALPPIAAYAAMAMAALYCISDFSDLDAPGNRQMVAVAELLVFVQAILMLQRKSRRILEQLGVFCLLQLIVAAVFNDAISYGLLLIPIGLIGGWALCLLSTVSAWDGLSEAEGLECESRSDVGNTTSRKIIVTSSPDSVRSLAVAATRAPRVALVALAPSVLLIGAIFFYALPRTTDAARITGRGTALVGFSDSLRLEQIGHMMQSTEPALRIHIQHDGTGRPFQVVGSLYLRGRVLEDYVSQIEKQDAGSWKQIPTIALTRNRQLPNAFFPRRRSDRNFYDAVHFEVTCEAMHYPSLFAVAPYHRRQNDAEIVHELGRWTISRRSQSDWTYPRKVYRFGSHSFRNGVQSDLTARYSESEQMATSTDDDIERFERAYVKGLLNFDVDRIPTAQRLADAVVLGMQESTRSDYLVAKQLERFLASSGGFRYSMDLSVQPVPGLDPLEQFLSIDRKGHCQYFASALVMMLRSQGIPARIVVGYRTEEFNELGQYYVARQLHAHCWVEALISRDQLPNTREIYGQPASSEYWLRLDPTPGGGDSSDAPRGGVGQVLDLAQNFWDDYVVDMDAGNQEEAVLSAPGITPMSQSYGRLIESITQKIAQVRAGQLGGGSLASRQMFSWPAALLGVLLTLVITATLKLRAPRWIRHRLRTSDEGGTHRPTVPFYVATLDQLARVGIVRRQTQTPVELSNQAGQQLERPEGPPVTSPLDQLTTAFYQIRFGSRHGTDLSNDTVSETSPEVEQALQQLTASIDQIEATGIATGIAAESRP